MSSGWRSTRRPWPRASAARSTRSSHSAMSCAAPVAGFNIEGASSGRTALWRFATPSATLSIGACSTTASRRAGGPFCTSRSANGWRLGTRPGPPRCRLSLPSISSAVAIDAAPSRTSSKPRDGRSTGSPTATPLRLSIPPFGCSQSCRTRTSAPGTSCASASCTPSGCPRPPGTWPTHCSRT